MAVDMFLNIDGITGESQDDAHGDEIDVIAFHWGMSNTGTAHLGGGAGAGKVNVQDLTFTKYIDKSSTDLMLFCCNGKHLTESVLIVRKAGEEPLEYIKITMTDCLITAVNTGAARAEERPTETITLNFGKVEVEYTPQKSDGSGEAPTIMGWDIAKNVKV